MKAEADPRRKALRLAGDDYGQPGAYFVTLVTQDRVARSGAVVDGEMQLNAAGSMAARAWSSLQGRFPGVTPADYVVRPNHFHGILAMHDSAGVTLVSPGSGAGINPAPTARDRRPPNLGAIVGALKSVTTNRHGEGVTRGTWPAFQGRLWQRGCYDHIIRDEADWRRLHDYIEVDPLRWGEDEENPAGADDQRDWTSL
jgi:putative transposase